MTRHLTLLTAVVAALALARWGDGALFPMLMALALANIIAVVAMLASRRSFP